MDCRHKLTGREPLKLTIMLFWVISDQCKLAESSPSHSLPFWTLYMCLQLIEKYKAVAREIIALPSIETFDMIRLDCEDLKRGLADAAKELANTLLIKVTDDHRVENKSWVDPMGISGYNSKTSTCILNWQSFSIACVFAPNVVAALSSWSAALGDCFPAGVQYYT